MLVSPVRHIPGMLLGTLSSRRSGITLSKGIERCAVLIYRWEAGAFALFSAVLDVTESEML